MKDVTFFIVMGILISTTILVTINILKQINKLQDE